MENRPPTTGDSRCCVVVQQRMNKDEDQVKRVRKEPGDSGKLIAAGGSHAADGPSSSTTAVEAREAQSAMQQPASFLGRLQREHRAEDDVVPSTAIDASSLGDACPFLPPPYRIEKQVSGFSMREQDAELLESMHEDGSTGLTPIVTGKKGEASAVEALSLRPPESCFSIESPQKFRESLYSIIPTTPSDYMHQETMQFLDMPPPSQPYHVSTRSLSGEVTLLFNERLSVAKRPSISDEIRIQEVAAFAEAVGDASILMCDIIDDDDDESENETETVIHHRLLDPLLPAGTSQTDTMIGICTPDIVQRGVGRGNYATLHRKALLEVSDKYHRYGKHLRKYYKYWEAQGCPTNQFFDWLDSKGTAAGCPLPELSSCPRKVLDSDTVLYITNPTVTEQYQLTVTTNKRKQACILDRRGKPVDTGPDGWIFVLRDQVLYGAPKITSVVDCSTQRFHHSSFFGGKAVAAAGILITDSNGTLLHIYPHSGHYRPTAAHLQRVLFFLYDTAGVDLSSGLTVDAQQIWHVARDPDAPKRAQLHMVSAMDVALFLAHKARSIPSFGRLHGIAKEPTITTVREALAVIDQGGYWGKKNNADESSTTVARVNA